MINFVSFIEDLAKVKRAKATLKCSSNIVIEPPT